MLTDKDTDTLSGANIEEYLFSSSSSLPMLLKLWAFSISESSAFPEVSQ